MPNSFTDIVSRLIATLSGTITNIDTRVGTVVRDSFLTPEATEFLNVYNQIDTNSANQGVNTAQQQSDASLENLASNYGESRAVGTYSSGLVTLYRYNQPTITYPIPTGTIVYTDTSIGRVAFRTITANVLSPSSDFDSDLGAYYIDVFVMCDVTGTIGNVAANSVTYITFPGIDGVTNRNDMSGGKDAQTNDELVALIKSTARGNLGTRTGYESMVRENFAVDDVKIITPDDSDYVRTNQVGAIDIIVLNNNRVTAEEDFPFISPTATTEITPSFLPLLGVSSLTGEGVTGLAVVLSEGSTGDYDVDYDTYSDYRRGQSELSKINLHTAILKNNSMINVIYETSSVVSIIEAFFEREENKAIGADVMVKMGIEIPTLVTAKVRLIPGHNSIVVISAIQDALTAHFNALLLDDDVQVSDVLTVIGNVAGVDSVNVPALVFALASDPLVPVQEVTADKQEYIRLQNSYITVEA